MIRTIMIALGAAAALAGTPAAAQEMYVGEILFAPFGFCPSNTVPADGKPAASLVLTSLFGKIYGGTDDNPLLPDLRGRGVVGQGQGPGLTNIVQGAKAGVESVVLTENTMPFHSHIGQMVASDAAPNSSNPLNAALGPFDSGAFVFKGPAGHATPTLPMATGTVTLQPAGSSAPMPVRDPYVAITMCVVTAGDYPNKP